jgi:hypothetical protein
MIGLVKISTKKKIFFISFSLWTRFFLQCLSTKNANMAEMTERKDFKEKETTKKMTISSKRQQMEEKKHFVLIDYAWF